MSDLYQQDALALDTPAVELSRFVVWNEYPDRPAFRVGGVGGRRSGQEGIALGNIALKHAGGYEVVMQFPDGKIDSFHPMNLFPAEAV